MADTTNLTPQQKAQLTRQQNADNGAKLLTGRRKQTGSLWVRLCGKSSATKMPPHAKRFLQR